MGKNSSLNYKAEIKTNIAIVCALVMLIGFLTSRAVLSIGTIAFGVNALIGIHPKEWLKSKWWLLGLVWVGFYAISGLWSDNMLQWSERVEVKLPILLLPLAFTFLPQFSLRQIRVFTAVAALIYLGSMCYSLYFLLSDPSYYIEQYRFSKVLPTLAGEDYIRYSLSISLFIIWCIYILKHFRNKLMIWFIRMVIVVLCIYVHVVAVKTGLLVLYLFVFLYSVYMVFSRKPFVGLVIVLMIFVSAISAYKYVPTFEQKVDYFKYSWEVFEQGHYDSDYSDIGRLVSYDIALKLLPNYAAIGTGMGDMHDVMRAGYKQYYPSVPEFQQLKPHNQFLVVALGCGVPAMLIFLMWILFPLKWVKRNRNGFFMFAIWFLMFVPLMVEPFLELQFGVYVYLFYILWMAHAAKRSNEQYI